jgi:hypothetical protein
MNRIQQQNIARQESKANRLAEQARQSGTRRDQTNAGWAFNVLDRMMSEAEE